MPSGHLHPVLRYLTRVSDRPAEGVGDAQLLDRFARHGDEAAFELLVRRHGPMVLAVCRRVLGNQPDADDAFQATFLLLVRKAGSLRLPERLGPWLYGVAYRTAIKARTILTRLRSRQRQVDELPARPTADEVFSRDLRRALDDAIHRLPSKYRVPFVLCYLEGMTNAQAAHHLRCPPGTIATRLSRARDRLRARLTKQGLGLSAGLFTTLLTQNAAPGALPASLVTATLRAGLAGAVLAAPVAALTKGVWQAMLMERMKVFVFALLAVGALGVGAGVLKYHTTAAEPPVEPGSTRVVFPSPPLPVRDDPPLAVPATRAQEPEASATYPTVNFVVTAPTMRLARLIGVAAEEQRRLQAVRWLGKEMPRWTAPCPIQVSISAGNDSAPGRTGAATSFVFDKGQIARQEMRLDGALDQILASMLPHEMTHTVFAHAIGAPVPRWADEGAAVLSEDGDDQRRQEKALRKVQSERRLIPLRRLMSMSDYPRDVEALFAQGTSLTRFLLRGDQARFLTFLKDGLKDGWDTAVANDYGYKNVDDLENAWLASLAPAAGSAGEETGPGNRSRLQLPKRMGPVVTVAVADESIVTIGWPVRALVKQQQLVQPSPGEPEAARVVTSYHEVVTYMGRTFALSDVTAFTADGKSVDDRTLRQRLRERTTVLVALDGLPVDPVYLQAIKKDTLVLIPRVAAEPPTATPVVPSPIGIWY